MFCFPDPLPQPYILSFLSCCLPVGFSDITTAVGVGNLKDFEAGTATARYYISALPRSYCFDEMPCFDWGAGVPF